MRLIFFLVACRSPEVDGFLDARAEAICAREARCDTLDASGYADEAACIESMDDATAALGREGALECDGFDAAAADECVAAWNVACDVTPDLSVCDAVCGG